MFAIVRAAQFSPFSALMGYENPQPFFMLFLNVPKMQNYVISKQVTKICLLWLFISFRDNKEQELIITAYFPVLLKSKFSCLQDLKYQMDDFTMSRFKSTTMGYDLRKEKNVPF